MKLTDIKRGDKVVYIPAHMITASDKHRLADENLGIVTSKNDTFVFIQFLGNIQSQAVKPEDLYTLEWRHDLQEKIPDLPEKTF